MYLIIHTVINTILINTYMHNLGWLDFNYHYNQEHILPSHLYSYHILYHISSYLILCSTLVGRTWYYSTISLCQVFHWNIWRNIIILMMTMFDAVWRDVMSYDMIWYDVIWYNMIWNDMIWYDIIWYDMIWCDVMWYDMIWYDMI